MAKRARLVTGRDPPQGQPAGGLHETRIAQGAPDSGAVHERAIDLFDRQSVEAAGARGGGEIEDRRVEHGLIAREGECGLAAALEIQREHAVDEHHDPAGLAPRPM